MDKNNTEISALTNYFYELYPDLNSCDNQIINGGKKKKQRGGGDAMNILRTILCIGSNKVYNNSQNSNTKISNTKMSDLPLEIIIDILRRAKEKDEDVRKLMKKISLIDKDSTKIKENLLNFTKTEQDEPKMWLIYCYRNMIYSNFIDYIFKYFRNIIESNVPLEILFTKDHTFNHDVYKIIYKKIICTKMNDNNINIKIYFGTYNNLEYINKTNKLLDDDGPLVTNIKKLLQNKITLFDKEFSIDFFVDPKKSIFEQIYSKILNNNGYIVNSDINHIINNDFYIKFPKESQQIGEAYTYFLEIEKELKIKHTIFECIFKDQHLNELFKNIELVEPNVSVSEIEQNIQEPIINSDYRNLFDVYFNKSDIDDIILYIIKFKRPETIAEFIQKGLKKINDPVMSFEEKNIYTKVDINLKNLRKNNIINKINS